MSETQTFSCSICMEPSTEICIYCTKDTCANHLCVKCMRCSDCCECEVPLEESAVLPHTQAAFTPAAPEPEQAPEPEAPEPGE
jgi:hypothetical protein